MKKKFLNNKLIVGRGSTALYLVLRNNLKDKEVIVPANICYAVPYAVIYSGNIPVFVDIKDDYSGNTNLDLIKDKVNSNTGAVIFPYMYGNVTEEILEIKNFCGKNNIILIEDCASAMGGKINESPVGIFGDYSFFSTGHAKNVDLGNGGILFSDLSLFEVEKEYRNINKYSTCISEKQKNFSTMYRDLRNNGSFEDLKQFLNNYEELQDLFVYQLCEREEDVLNSFSIAENKKANTQKYYNLYKELLPKVRCLEHNSGSYPWRFSIYVDDSIARQRIVEHLLEENLFVSDWYPCIAKYFDERSSYKNAELQGNQILNFSLDISKDKIEKICKIINNNL